MKSCNSEPVVSSSYNATDSVSLSDYSVFYSDRKNSSSIMTEDFTADLCLRYYKSLIHSHTRAHTHHKKVIRWNRRLIPSFDSGHSLQNEG